MTSPFNPYEPPAADELERRVQASGSSGRLASLAQRWLAALIDALLAALVVAPLQYKFGMLAKFSSNTVLTFRECATWGAVYFVVWLAENGYWLASNAQTIGKRLVGIRIEDISGGRATLWKIVLLRNLVFSCIANIPAVGIVVLTTDTLLIFGKGRRCLHDHLAGTHVVKV